MLERFKMVTIHVEPVTSISLNEMFNPLLKCSSNWEGEKREVFAKFSANVSMPKFGCNTDDIYYDFFC